MALPAESQRAHESTAPAPAAEGRSAFQRVLAHELRNHIATINNTLFMLRLQSGKLASTPTAAAGAARTAATGDESKPMLDMIERQTAAMTRALNLMVEAERVEQG